MSEPKEPIHYYASAPNDDGWQQGKNILGKRPDLDKEMIGEKVSSIMQSLHDNKLIYISNATQGEYILELVVYMCKSHKKYDQKQIIYYILEELIEKE